MLQVTKDVIITESVLGTWFYHLSDSKNFTRSFCGAHVMKTSMTHKQWGFKGHLKERYCDKCVEIATELFIKVK